MQEIKKREKRYNILAQKNFQNKTKAFNQSINNEKRAHNVLFFQWLAVLNKIRTFFKENPDADF
ncbi:hypothetical protein KJ656_09455 [bacterium]|nr:hypothetical protein [bacterium]